MKKRRLICPKCKTDLIYERRIGDSWSLVCMKCGYLWKIEITKQLIPKNEDCIVSYQPKDDGLDDIDRGCH